MKQNSTCEDHHGFSPLIALYIACVPFAEKGSYEVSSEFNFNICQMFLSDVTVTVNEGDNITLNCSLSGPNINWTFQGKLSETGQNLTISTITRHQSGAYMCHNGTSGLGEQHNVTVECKCRSCNFSRMNFCKFLVLQLW